MLWPACIGATTRSDAAPGPCEAEVICAVDVKIELIESRKQACEFFRREEVVWQTFFGPVEWNERAWLDLFKA